MVVDGAGVQRRRRRRRRRIGTDLPIHARTVIHAIIA
jgi:hypothetical protein